MIPQLGRLAPRMNPLDDPSILKLGPQHLVAAELPKLPAAKNWADGVAWDSDPLGNTQYGDCTVVAIAKLITHVFALLGRPSPITADEVVRIYLRLTGGADSGLVFRDVLDFAQREGICGVKLSTVVAFDWRDRRLMSIASGIGGGLLIGAAMPVEAQTQDVWSRVPGMTPGSWGGHAIYRPGHSPAMGNYNSWGEAHDATDEWEDDCVDEAYVCLVEGAAPPCGLDLEAIRADLALL
jgi:hypothetical protein